jgi:YVTN family beta-propeller protein
VRGRQAKVKEADMRVSRATGEGPGRPGRGAWFSGWFSFVRRRPARVLGVAAIATVLMILGSSGAAVAGKTSPPFSTARWQHAIQRLHVPGKGCFAASYPKLQWREVRCKAAPDRRYSPARGHRPLIVGDGIDYSADVSGLMSSATGSFDHVTPGATETSNGVANSFSLQLNSKPFSPTPACSGSGTPGECQGWEQFIYSSDYNEVLMQYWLINYNATCPSGWNTYGGDCWKNSPASPWPGTPLAVADLATVTLTGTAMSGGNDSVIMTTHSGQATATNADDLLSLAKSWDGVEFGVFGDGDGSEADFSPGTTINVRTSVENGTETAPTCVFQGYTGETNNLNLVGTPAIGQAAYPAIVSEQSNSVSTTQSCATAAGGATATIPVGKDPNGITADTASHTVYVSNEGSDTVSVISEATGKVTDTINVGAEPQGLAVDPNTGTVWVTNYAAGTVSVISQATNTVIKTINVDPNGTSAGPNSLVVDAPTHTVYIGQYQGYVTAINDQTYAVTQGYNTNGKSHLGVSAVNPATDTLYVHLADLGSIGEINTTTNTLTATLSGLGLPANPAALENSSAAGYPGYMYAPTLAIPGVVVCANMNTGSGLLWNVIHAPAGQTTIDVAVDPATNTLFESLKPSSGNGSIAIISGASGTTPTTTATIAAGNNPGRVIVDPGEGPTGTVFVVNSGSNTVTAFPG